MNKPDFTLGTILLEKNRWKRGNDRVPSYCVSDWVSRIQTDGFSGLELWENHVLCDGEEARRLLDCGFPITVYNTYAEFTVAGQPERNRASEMIRFLHAEGVKYNVGGDANLFREYREQLIAFANRLPDSCCLLCECHQGTILEDKDTALRFFSDLPADRYQIILHGIGFEPDVLRDWFNGFGQRISRVHVQLSDDDRRICLFRKPEKVRQSLQIMKESGFVGHFTLEFTEGTAEPDENIESLYRNALSDMAFIKENWS